eukprot:930018-Amphidinium_carterae.1
MARSRDKQAVSSCGGLVACLEECKKTLQLSAPFSIAVATLPTRSCTAVQGGIRKGVSCEPWFGWCDGTDNPDQTTCVLGLCGLKIHCPPPLQER